MCTFLLSYSIFSNRLTSCLYRVSILADDVIRWKGKKIYNQNERQNYLIQRGSAAPRRQTLIHKSSTTKCYSITKQCKLEQHGLLFFQTTARCRPSAAYDWLAERLNYVGFVCPLFGLSGRSNSFRLSQRAHIEIVLIAKGSSVSIIELDVGFDGQSTWEDQPPARIEWGLKA